MTIKEAADELRISEQSVRLFIQSGELGICRKNKYRMTYLVDEQKVRRMCNDKKA